MLKKGNIIEILLEDPQVQSVGWFLRGLNGTKMIHERLTRVKQWMIEIVWDREDDCFVDKIIQNCWI